ncbi:hypothetical protein PAMP_020166 [Pampus punctatissimus]
MSAHLNPIWIRVCVHLLLFITLGVHSNKFDVNPVTDDISRLSVLRQNIPKDYKIPVHYVPKEEEPIMYDFECHYREERWPTARYFGFVKDFLIDAKHKEDSDDCDPPPCPTTPFTVKTETSSKESPTSTSAECGLSPDCGTNKPETLMSEVMEQSLLSLLFIPLLALVFLLVWKVRSRRNEDDLEQNPGEGGLFTGTEGTAPPLDAEISEKNKLKVSEIV